MDKFRDKYRIKSHRLPKWDYSDNGIYFITLVTQNRVCNLGQIVNTRSNLQPPSPQSYIQLSDFGKIVNDEWFNSFEIRHELFLDEYIIMPNHLHAIVILNKPENENQNETNCLHDSHDSHVETHGRASLQSINQFTKQLQSTNQLQSPNQSMEKTALIRKNQSISSFIAGFKSAINSKIDDFIDENNLDIPKYNRNNHFFQSDYYDHIIRNNAEYQRIKEYIINNPSKWNNDKFHIE